MKNSISNENLLRITTFILILFSLILFITGFYLIIQAYPYFSREFSDLSMIAMIHIISGILCIFSALLNLPHIITGIKKRCNNIVFYLHLLFFVMNIYVQHILYNIINLHFITGYSILIIYFIIFATHIFTIKKHIVY